MGWHGDPAIMMNTIVAVTKHTNSTSACRRYLSLTGMNLLTTKHLPVSLIARTYENYKIDSPLTPHRYSNVDVDEQRAQQPANASDGGEDGHLPEVPPEHAAVVGLVVGEQSKVPVHAKLGTREIQGVEIELMEPVRGEHTGARGEETTPEHAGGVEARALFDGEQHAADGRAERHGYAHGGSDGDEIPVNGK